MIITGATGTGKTYVACALAQQACRKGFRAIYRRVPRLFDELRSRAPTARTRACSPASRRSTSWCSTHVEHLVMWSAPSEVGVTA